MSEIALQQLLRKLGWWSDWWCTSSREVIVKSLACLLLLLAASSRLSIAQDDTGKTMKQLPRNIAESAAVKADAQARKESWKTCTGNDPDRSIPACTALIQSAQQSAKSIAIALDSRGLAYARKRDFDRAIEDYDRSLQINPDSATAHYNRGVAYEFKHDYERALPDLDRAVQLDPGDADSFFCRGLALEQRRDYERAIRDFDHVLRINPKYAAAFFNRAISYWHKGNYAGAAADYGRWHRLKSGPVTLVQLCVLLFIVSFAVGYVRRSLQHSCRTIGGEQSHFTSLFSHETTKPDGLD
jgi:tetratricopeptide (TPR) repeat protein